VETRAYMIDLDDLVLEDHTFSNMPNEEWMNIAEKQGGVYSLPGFARAYNSEELPYNTFIRFINV
jgi:hypothetical protein